MTPLPYSLILPAMAQAKQAGAIGITGGTAYLVSRVFLGGKALKLRNGDIFNTEDDPAVIPADINGTPEGVFAVALSPQRRFIGLYRLQVGK